jgi:hypothetical protein
MSTAQAASSISGLPRHPRRREHRRLGGHLEDDRRGRRAERAVLRTSADWSDGGAGTQAVWPVLLRAFPDLHVEMEDLIEEGDTVVARDTVTGTHQGEYRGLPPTGKSVTTKSI